MTLRLGRPHRRSPTIGVVQAGPDVIGARYPDGIGPIFDPRRSQPLNIARNGATSGVDEEESQAFPGSGENKAALPGLSFHSSASAGASPLRVMLGHSDA